MEKGSLASQLQKPQPQSAPHSLLPQPQTIPQPSDHLPACCPPAPRSFPSLLPQPQSTTQPADPPAPDHPLACTPQPLAHPPIS